MLFVRSRADAARASNAAVRGRVVGVTIGNFDGFHLGHQALVKKLFSQLGILEQKLAKPGFSVLLSFFPHPRWYFSGVHYSDLRAQPELLPVSSMRQKIRAAKEAGFDLFYSARFNRAFSEMTAEEFASEILVDTLAANLVVIGDDWRFGKGREGSPESLGELGIKYGFEVVVVPAVDLDGARVSSGRAREAIDDGRVADAAELLGRNLRISGRVVHGEKRGRDLGFPTANIHPQIQRLPKNGVYLTTLRLAGQALPAVSNIGIRPTFGQGQRTVEVHVLDQELSIYGASVELEFHKRLRDEQRFSSVEELVAAISNDVAQAREYFANVRD